jgi:CRISPR-associated protein Cas1
MGRTLYLMTSGELSRKDNTIVLESEMGKKYIPIETTDEVLVFGEVTLNKRFLEFSSKCEVILHFFNYYGGYIGTFYPREHLNAGAVILAQARHCMEADLRQRLAVLFVEGAILNMQKVVTYYERRTDCELNDILESLEKYRELAGRTETVFALMGLEGNARECYYTFFDRIAEDKAFVMGKRTRRPPDNRMNALISFLNSLCYVAALSQIYRTHLDPRIGFLHETNFRRFSLNLDIAEIFKPILVDRLILTLINKRMIQPRHFSEKAGGILLTDSGREIVLKSWEERLQSTIEHPALKRSVSYRNLLRMEAYKLEKHILGEKEYSPFASRW